MILYASNKLLGRSPIKTYLKWGSNLIIYIACIHSFSKIYKEMIWSNYLKLICYAGVTYIIIMAIFFIINSMIDKKSFNYLMKFMKAHLRNKGRTN